MNVLHVQKRLRLIEAYVRQHNDESAHRQERALYLAVLRELARRGEPLAIEAVKANEMTFSRWFA